MFIIKIPNDWIRTVHVEAIALPTEPQSLPLVIVCLPSENWLLTQPPRMVKAMYLPTYLPIIGDSNQQSYFCILWSEKMAFNWNESLSHSLASHTGGRGQLNLDHSSTQILNLLDEKFDRPVVISCQWSFYDANAHKGCNVKGVGVTFT